jgi:hypothetical protein
MTASRNNSLERNEPLDEKAEMACIEDTVARVGPIPPTEIQARFPLLRDLSQERMDELNKRVRSKIDWHMMPCVTLMFLMK